ncbi:hypothetical protein [Chromobacterium sp. IIBBL 290-4]|uniref:hypothetical protein n=1 Tax=Chromobacterium sp. IIBBL 290-4 TaxID=2953890 RepID=UPI0020B8C505|nr:hypothetical protein [Chromobacterium sp. IIBBL 290-4]UTH76389.1 hypothetical protein NKT35_09900 [Chromobacterium sp. IIBBL 290-4]
MARLGFKLDIKWVDKVRDINSLVPQLKKMGDFDLILMDWNLGEKENDGAVVAKRLRSGFHTEIVFYSSASPSDLRRAIFEQDIDGVYCTRRDSLTAEAMAVINNTIKKVLDLNHMRGLVMSAVSDFDFQIDESIRLRYEQLDAGEKEALVDSIRQRIIKVCNSNVEQIQKLSEIHGIEEIIEHRSFSSALKCQVLNSILSTKEDDRTVADLLAVLGRYDSEIIKPRNALAHARPIEKDGKITFKGRDIEFNDEEFRKIRLNLIAHEETLSDIRSVIAAGGLN